MLFVKILDSLAGQLRTEVLNVGFCVFLQALRKGIATMNEDGFIGKDEVVMQVQCHFSAISVLFSRYDSLVLWNSTRLLAYVLSHFCSQDKYLLVLFLSLF